MCRRRAPDRGTCDQHNGWSATTWTGEPWSTQALKRNVRSGRGDRKRLADLNPVSSTGWQTGLLKPAHRAYWDTRRRNSGPALQARRINWKDRLEGIAQNDTPSETADGHRKVGATPTPRIFSGKKKTGQSAQF